MLLTLAIAVYNSEKYLSQMVESVLNQSFRDYELFLIDDGSSDGSGVLCDYFASKDTRVKVIHKINAGLCASRNLAINLAHGEYICFLDHDDIMLPDMLKSFVDIVSSVNFDFYLNGYCIRVEDTVGKIIERRIIAEEKMILTTPSQIKQFYLDHLGGVVAPIWTHIYSVSFLIDNNLKFDETLHMSLDDLSFHISSYFCANKVFVSSHIGNEYYVRPSPSSSRKYNEMYNIQCAQVLLKLNESITANNMLNCQNTFLYSKIVLRQFVILGLQNIVYARKLNGRKITCENIDKICCNQTVIDAINILQQNIELLSRFEKLICTFVKLRNKYAIYFIFSFKDTIKFSFYIPFIKHIAGSTVNLQERTCVE